MPLTEHRAKPAVTFGAKYRVIDFVMSNCVNSDLNKIYIFPQHLNQSLNEHLLAGWNIFHTERDQFMRIVSPQGRVSDAWYTGTAASVHENFHSIGIADPKYVIVLSSDQIYKMDYREVLQSHIDTKAELTIVALPVKQSEAHRYGVLKIDKRRRIKGFVEKPTVPEEIPGRPGESLASTAIYIFNSKTLVETLNQDRAIKTSSHDFGKDVIPRMLRQKRRVFAYLFQDQAGRPKHWVDIGNPDAFFEANMDLVSSRPKFDLYDKSWPWRTCQSPIPPQKFVSRAKIESSVVSDGCVFGNCTIKKAIISPKVKIGDETTISDSIIMGCAQIGDNVRISRAIIDKYSVIPDNTVIDAESTDYQGDFTITPSGIVIIPRKCSEWAGR